MRNLKRIALAITFAILATEGWQATGNIPQPQIVIKDQIIDRPVVVVNIRDLNEVDIGEFEDSPEIEPNMQAMSQLVTNRIAWPMQEQFDIEVAEVDANELHCLATVIYHESKSEIYAGQVAVGKVVLNRVNGTEHANTICKVMREKIYEYGKVKGCQFTWYCDGKSDKMHNPKQRARAIAIAKRLMLNPNSMDNLIPAITDRVEWFATPSGARGWHDGALLKVASIGNHQFYQKHE